MPGRERTLAEVSAWRLARPALCPYPCPAMGNPASFQAATPPLRALALGYPILIKAAA
jgi:hypothetical protein